MVRIIYAIFFFSLSSNKRGEWRTGGEAMETIFFFDVGDFITWSILIGFFCGEAFCGDDVCGRVACC